MFPSAQDIRTHRSVVAKKRKRDAERPSITTPQQLCEEVLGIASKQYRAGETNLWFRVAVPSDNFIDWARERNLIGESLDLEAREVMHRRAAREARGLVKKQLTQGTFLGKLVATPLTTKGNVVFEVQISVINPKLS